MEWAIIIATLILGGIYSGVRDCLAELKKISMHARATEELLTSAHANTQYLRMDLQQIDERMRNVETAANLAWDRMMKAEHPGVQNK